MSTDFIGLYCTNRNKHEKSRHRWGTVGEINLGGEIEKAYKTASR